MSELIPTIKYNSAIAEPFNRFRSAFPGSVGILYLIYLFHHNKIIKVNNIKDGTDGVLACMDIDTLSLMSMDKVHQWEQDGIVNQALLARIDNSDDAFLHDVFMGDINSHAHSFSPEVLFDVILLFNNIGKSSIENNYIEIFEFYCSNCLDNILPSELTELIWKLLDYKGGSVYNPFAGASSIGISSSIPLEEYFGDEIDPLMWSIGKIRLDAYGKSSDRFRLQNSFASLGQEEEKFDYIISFPPISITNPSINVGMTLDQAFLEYGIRKLNKGGKLLGVVGPSIFNDRSQSFQLRKMLVDSRYVNTVIQLPNGLLSTTGIGLFIIILNDSNSSAAERISFIDASSFVIKTKRTSILNSSDLLSAIDQHNPYIVKKCTYDEVVNNGYSLIPNRYFSADSVISIPEGFELKQLSEIVTIAHGLSKETQETRLVRGRDLAANGPFVPLTFEELIPEATRNNKANVVNHDAILLLKVGQLKPTLFSYSGIDISLNPNVIAILPNDGIDNVYLANELRKDYVSEQVKRMSNGMVIPHLSLDDVLSIKVLVPKNLSMQKASLANEERLAKEQTIKSQHVQEYLERYKNSIFEMLSIRRHRIKPYLSGLSSNVAMLLEDIGKSGVLQADHELFDGYTVKDALLNMKQNLAEVSSLFKKMTSEVDTGDEESFDLLQFVKDYSYNSKLPDRQIKVVADTPSDVADFGPIVFNRDNLREILDEIIFNAQKHFAPGTTDGTVALVPKAETDGISLLVCNNGNPLPEDFDEEKSFTAGYFRDENGTGMGLFRVRQVCDNFGATIEWANDPTSTMPVALRITFKRSTI